jgi:hypothetical protein
VTDQPKPGFREKVVREMKNFAIIFLYVWVIIALFTLHKNLILSLPPLSGQMFAFINAFVLGKIILLLEMLKVGEILQTKPPVFRLVIKAAAFGLLLLAFTILEETVKGWFHGEAFEESMSKIAGGTLEGMLIEALIMSVALLPYLACKELGRILGRERLLFVIFRPPAPNETPSAALP